jgi:hypothetical protein
MTKAKKTTQPTTTVHNNTPFSLDEIAKFAVLGETVNKWRQRNITLYQHPTETDMVVSVGTIFGQLDYSMTVIAVEPKDAWATALDYAAHGKVYVSE